jgi:ribosomal protein S18 acetylase RimI-like enzyme
MTDYTVKRLTPSLAEDFLAFFDGPAFADNADWAGCYCRCYHVPEGERWDEADAVGNRADTAQRIADGRMAGYLAYAGGAVVGWLSAGASRFYPLANVGGEDVQAERMGHIVCFVVAPEARGQGVARALLDAALAGFKADGLTIAQGAPRPAAEGGAANYHGPMSLFERAGFARHRDAANGKTTYVRRAV